MKLIETLEKGKIVGEDGNTIAEIVSPEMVTPEEAFFRMQGKVDFLWKMVNASKKIMKEKYNPKLTNRQKRARRKNEAI